MMIIVAVFDGNIYLEIKEDFNCCTLLCRCVSASHGKLGLVWFVFFVFVFFGTYPNTIVRMNQKLTHSKQT